MSSETVIIGSRWWKIDFHAHSPASDDYGREDASLKNIEPEVWLQKAMEAGLDCVVLSDHDSGSWVDRVKAKNKVLQEQENKPEWFRVLTIFPGVEITVADSSSVVHLLAVFDPSCDGQMIERLVGSCTIGPGVSFCETAKKIKEVNGIAIAAHIDGPKGLLEKATSLTPQLKNSLQAVAAAEFCNPEKFNQAASELKEAVNRFAKLGGSDAHKPDDIGKHFSWLKMSRPSIEGLRLALMDHQYCVNNQAEDPNRPPDLYLSELTIKNMSHCGRIKNQPFIMPLHPHFNAIIGSRGTGKSTALESIRIAARRDQNLNKDAPKIKKKLDAFSKLAQSKEGVMPQDTEIILELRGHGKNFRLRWRYDGQGAVLEEQNGEHHWQATETGNLHERFPLSIYSQKQIEELAENPRGLLGIIDRRDEVYRSAWQLKWDNVKSEFSQLKEQCRKLERQLAEEPQLRVKLNDVKNDLQQYEDKGHGAILKQYQKCIQQKNGLPDDQIFNDLSSGLRILAVEADMSDFPSHLFDEQDTDAAELRAIHEKVTQELKIIAATIGTLAEQVDFLKKKRQDAVAASKWQQAVQVSMAAYQKLLEEYKEKNSNFSDYGKWVQERGRLQQEIDSLDSLKEEKKLVERQIDEKLNNLCVLRSELFCKRKNFINNVVGNSKYVHMGLVQFGDVSSLEEDYRNLLTLGNDVYKDSVLDDEKEGGILHKLYNWQDTHQKSELPQLIQEIKDRTRAIAEGRDLSCHGKFCNKLKEVLQKQPALFDQIDAWWPEDMLRVKHSRDGKFDDIGKGSAGQKAAAILAFLLSHGNEPLIIDQPEDDLDNSLIYQLIVKQIHDNKDERRQLIIVTHNPNIVVNGDAELVHVLKFANGQVQIDQQGGLCEPKIRKAICDIMEGGKEAFRKRYERMMQVEPTHV